MSSKDFVGNPFLKDWNKAHRAYATALLKHADYLEGIRKGKKGSKEQREFIESLRKYASAIRDTVSKYQKWEKAIQ